jgi:hypothetical protein
MRTLSVFLAGVMIVGIAFTSLGFEADFEPSDYNPAPGDSVAFEVTSSCATDEAFATRVILESRFRQQGVMEREPHDVRGFWWESPRCLRYVKP